MRGAGGTVRRALAFAVVLLLLATPVGLAGSRGNPEVRDDREDLVDPVSGDAPTGPAVANLDLRGVWFHEINETHYSMHIRVDDLTDPPEFRSGITRHAYRVEFTSDADDRFALVVARDAFGGSLGQLQVLGQADTESPRTDRGTMTVEFDSARDEVVSVLPRTMPGVITSPNPRSISFNDGTTLYLTRAISEEGVGDAPGLVSTDPIDRTGPGRPFTFGHPAGTNPAVEATASQAVVEAGGGAVGTIEVTVRGHPTEETQTELKAVPVESGWAVEPSMVSVALGPGETREYTFLATPPAGALDGAASVVIVHGAARPVTVLAVVGSEASRATKELLGEARPQTTLASTLELYLRDSTQHRGGEPSVVTGEVDEEPVFPAQLVSEAPAVSGDALVTRIFEDADRRLPLGVWKSSAVSAPLVINGSAALQIPVQWSGMGGFRLEAVLGANLPVTWTEADRGSAAFLNSSALAASGQSVVELSGSTQRLVVWPGERLEVSLYASRTSGGDGSVQATLYDEDDPAMLSATVELGANADGKSLIPGQGAAFALWHVQPLGADVSTVSRTVSVEIDGQPAASLANHQLRAGVAIGNGSDVLPESFNTSGFFAAGDAGPEDAQSHAISLVANATELRLVLRGQSTGNHYTNNAFYIDLYRVNDTGRTLVKQARSYAFEQELVLTFEEIEDIGTGAYEVDVWRPTWATSGAQASYELAVTQLGNIARSDALRTDVVIVQDPDAIQEGATLVVTSTWTTQGTVVLELDREYVVTASGITAPPVASFTAASTVVTAGQPLSFQDTSKDADGSIVSWSWDFGDGTTSAEANPTHTFQKIGSYSVFLIVTDNLGATATSLSIPISVVAPGDGPKPDAPTVELPTGEGTPLGGTISYYKGHYDLGLAHTEAYGADWAAAELSGLVAGDYVVVDDRPVYAFGNVPAQPSTGTVDATSLTASNLVGAEVSWSDGSFFHTLGAHGIDVQRPSATFNGVPVDLATGSSGFAPDDWSDGLLEAIRVSEVSTLDKAAREARLLEGAIHSDFRTVLGAEGADLGVTQAVSLPLTSGSWVAHPGPDGIQVTPVTGFDDAAFSSLAPGDRWFAVFDPDQPTVHGVVLGGPVERIRTNVQADALRLTVSYAATSELVAAVYPVAYEVADANATRYAAIQEVARQDAQELGMAYLEGDRTASVGWATSGANLQVGTPGPAAAWWDGLTGVDEEWTLTITAQSDQGGKPVRLVLPAAALDEGGIAIELDGQSVPLSSVSAVRDDDVLILSVPIDHFSTRALRIQELIPGISPVFLWATFAFGSMVGVASLGLGALKLRSRAASRAMSGKPPSRPASQALGLDAEDVGAPSDEEEAYEFRSTIMRRLAHQEPPEGPQEMAKAERRAVYARCRQCSSPLRFEPEEDEIKCASCGALNTRREVGS